MIFAVKVKPSHLVSQVLIKTHLETWGDIYTIATRVLGEFSWVSFFAVNVKPSLSIKLQ